ncbi:ParB/RepB/Spo0J family partition protein [Alteromonas sp. a30]|uniref:ParB/RepB/Spo0J family partition protein n=1 Tax=Alteromonas sp. a30 TaxID=2730917 RepID=UPI00227E2686|nr:ParB/RepB/Spo0J family partition protein [Alteromonas sp. a30]MCY7296890.1 hypothetical protein [Alteromonas sp. a30]
MYSNIEQLLLSKLNNNVDDKVFRYEEFEYKVLFLNKIFPDDSNPRYMPAIVIEDHHVSDFLNKLISKKELIELYKAQDRVLVGKGLFINCLKYGSKAWNNVNKTIESIIDLSKNIELSEVIQAPTVFQREDGNYQILTGHRRFLAMLYMFGTSGTAQFKVYKNPPLLKKTKQFQENSSREDLPQYGKLVAFTEAKREIEALSKAKTVLGKGKMSVAESANLLGISMGAYDNYNVLTRYPCVIDLYRDGLALSFVKTKSTVLKIENEYKKAHEKTKLNIEDKRKIDQLIKDELSGNNKTTEKKAASYKLGEINNANTMKTILEKNVFELDTNINWNELDWDDAKAVNQALGQLVDYLQTKH